MSASLAGVERGLTIHQPYPTLIRLGVKTVETRNWATKFRGDIAIHAGQAKPLSAVDRFWTEEHAGEWSLRHRPDSPGDPLPLGAVTAIARLADCVLIVDGAGCNDTVPHVCVRWGTALLHSRLDRPWPDGSTEIDVSDQLPYGLFQPGGFAWLLEDVRPVDPPVPMKGRQGLWKVPTGVSVTANE